jgi:hypothetical protein
MCGGYNTQVNYSAEDLYLLRNTYSYVNSNTFNSKVDEVEPFNLKKEK